MTIMPAIAGMYSIVVGLAGFWVGCCSMDEGERGSV